MKIITAQERMAEVRGIKALILGPPGVGKTSLLRTLNPDTTLFVDFEAGDLSVQDVQVDQLRPQTWDECRDLACYLAGPDLNLPSDAVYGQEHYDHVVSELGDIDLDKYDTFFIDSITVAGRKSFTWCEQQPEAKAKNGNKDTRAIYGEHGRQMIAWVSQLQHARTKNVIFVCLLDQKEDDYGRTNWVPQIDGSKTGNEMPGIVDEVLTMQFVPLSEITDEETDELVRAFVTSPDNKWGYPAKDRSGRLDAFEEPDLTDLFNKLKGDVGASAKNTTDTATTPETTNEKDAA